jgi:hypothetical protein
MINRENLKQGALVTWRGVTYRVLRILALSNHAEVVQVKTNATPTFLPLCDLEMIK